MSKNTDFFAEKHKKYNEMQLRYKGYMASR